jgi:hypothetical protein
MFAANQKRRKFSQESDVDQQRQHNDTHVTSVLPHLSPMVTPTKPDQHSNSSPPSISPRPLAAGGSEPYVKSVVRKLDAPSGVLSNEVIVF